VDLWIDVGSAQQRLAFAAAGSAGLGMIEQTWFAAHFIRDHTARQP